ncbi:hypothetical protein, partial [uncultured Bacteroides sp.]|uniref:hypothetical protein n=1 Tax=uncultured Bacteroides sp. TaxID=162156 RepID=UPI0026754571
MTYYPSFYDFADKSNKFYSKKRLFSPEKEKKERRILFWNTSLLLLEPLVGFEPTTPRLQI